MTTKTRVAYAGFVFLFGLTVGCVTSYFLPGYGWPAAAGVYFGMLVTENAP